ncbi:MAG: toll/interleukin-1 receptor domain-containing protein [Anaerolineales bacterium]|nr:toll/interleukin-1 receptor domain-containing protein [Anaerolineales bacterium]
MNSSLTEYLCLAIVVTVIIVAALIFAARSRKKTRASPKLIPELRSPILPAEAPRTAAATESPAGSRPHNSGAETSGRIFVSYRRSDSADIAGRIYDRLVGKFGRDLIFKDVDSIPLGIDFREYLGKKVSECDVLLAIIGDRWLEASDATGARRLDDPADFVRIEIEAALERGIPVIPLLVRGAQMPVEASLPVSLRKLIYRNGIQVRADPDFHHDMDRLIFALDRYVR